jgi:hypothetical protein
MADSVRSREQREPSSRAWSVALLLVTALVCSSCVLRENKEYVIQDAPPNGIHVTLKVGVSDSLKTASEFVASGKDLDVLLAKAGYGTVTCDQYESTVYNGDRCAFRLVRSTPTDGGLLEPAVDLYWSDALNWDEFDDFRSDAMSPIRKTKESCLHVTIKNVGEWPIEWRDSNWTYRLQSDSKCR